MANNNKITTKTPTTCLEVVSHIDCYFMGKLESELTSLKNKSLIIDLECHML